MNFNLENLFQWLKANKLSLYFSKAVLIIFHLSSTKIDHSLKFELGGKRLTVKYLGVLLDDHLIDGLHLLFWFRKLSCIRLDLAGKKQGKHKSGQIKPSHSNDKSLGRVIILFRFKKMIRIDIWRSQPFQMVNFCQIQMYP